MKGMHKEFSEDKVNCLNRYRENLCDFENVVALFVCNLEELSKMDESEQKV